MKFAKPLLLTSLFLLSIASIVIYTSCAKSKCSGISCKNGGTCTDGICSCPTGYEDPRCGTRVIARYIGTYAGFSSCNNGAEIIDSVFVSADESRGINAVKLIEKVHPTVTLEGYVTSNETTYQMYINDIVAPNYNKSFHVTLQSDNTLVLNSYERDYVNPLDSMQNTCVFNGTKH